MALAASTVTRSPCRSGQPTRKGQDAGGDRLSVCVQDRRDRHGEHDLHQQRSDRPELDEHPSRDRRQVRGRARQEILGGQRREHHPLLRDLPADQRNLRHPVGWRWHGESSECFGPCDDVVGAVGEADDGRRQRRGDDESHDERHDGHREGATAPEARLGSAQHGPRRDRRSSWPRSPRAGMAGAPRSSRSSTPPMVITPRTIRVRSQLRAAVFTSFMAFPVS